MVVTSTGHTRRIFNSCTLARFGTAKANRFCAPTVGTGRAAESRVAREIQERGYRFGRDVMRYAVGCEPSSVIGRDLLRQLFRAATSVGANLQEAHAGVTRHDFVHKIGLARKEAFEARHWLRLRRDMCPSDEALHPLQREADELCRILTAIILSAKRNDSRPAPQ